MKLPGSLHRHLLLWSVGALAAVWLTFMVAALVAGVHEADERIAGDLATAAEVTASFTAALPPQAGPAAADVAFPEAHEDQRHVSIRVWTANGVLVHQKGPWPERAADLPLGFFSLSVDGAISSVESPGWNGFGLIAPAGNFKIVTLLDSETRVEQIADLLTMLLLPGLVLLPLMTAALWFAINRGIQPLRRLAGEVGALQASKLKELQGRQGFAESDAIVAAINVLLHSQHETLARERQFALDVAHELRTPLTSISLQAQAMRAATNPAELDRASRQIGADSQRAAHVLQQLLGLAKAHRDSTESMTLLDLCALTSNVVASYAQISVDAGLDISLEAPPAAKVLANPVLIELVIRNLMDNAIKHSPRGSAIEVRVGFNAAMQLLLEVCNSTGELKAEGPASSSENCNAATLLGLDLGLGHQIIERVARLHDAKFEKDTGTGLMACYRFVFSSQTLL